MSPYPLVSVIIPVYNNSKMIGEAIDSIFAQDYPHLEIIVVDDGSTDNIRQVVKAYSDVHYIYKKNGGPASARNIGIKNSKGDYITFLDADDLYPINRISPQVQYALGHPDCLVVKYLVQYQYLSSKKKHISKNLNLNNDATIFSSNLGAILFKKEIFEKIGLLNESMRFAEDVEFLSRVYDKGIKIKEVAEVGLIYRVNENSMTNQVEQCKKGLIKTLYLRKKRLQEL